MATKTNMDQTKLRTLLKSRGMRSTAQRIAVLTVLVEAQSPMTHEEVVGVLPSGMYDKAAVWRVLSDLTNVEIVRRMDLGDRVWRYELQDDRKAVSSGHPHFLCESCGEVTCLPPLQVQTLDGQLPRALAGAEFHIRVSGNCRECIEA
jgi:Fur family ferric uptake transcriptional regulator